MRRPRSLLTALVVLLVTAPAVAHVTVRSSATEPGNGIVASLSTAAEREPLWVQGGTAEVNPNDPFRLVMRPASTSMTARVLAVDGHVTSVTVNQAGQIQTTARDPWLQMLGRTLLILALVAVAGAAIVMRAVILPGARAPLRPFGQPAKPVEATALTSHMTLRLRALVLLGAVGAVTGTVMVCAAVMARLGTTDLATLLSATRFGVVTGVLALVAFALLALSRRVAADGLSALVVAALAGAGLVALSLGGHATSGTDAVLGGLFDGLHMVATATWIGGLVALLLARRRIGAAATGALAAIVVRFSSLAVVSVAVIGVTGAYRALAELASFDDFVTTDYGRLLLAKLVVFAVMLAVGAYNRLVIHPRLERAAIGLNPTDRGAGRQLQTSVRAELALASILVCLVAVMIGFPPIR